MRAFTRRRLLASIKLGVGAVPFAVGLRLLHGQPIVPGTFISGFALGFVACVAELFWFRDRLKRLGFLSHVAVKSLLILALLYAAFAVLNLLDVWIDGITWSEYLGALLDPVLARSLLEALVVIAFLLFLLQLDRLLGPGVLLGYVTGRYHRPRREDRVFMFLDLRGSTELADRMEAERYFQFLHSYFSEMSEPILETDAEIYQYVGDEVVLTWKLRNGLEEANCVRAFFLIDDRMRNRRASFVDRFGVFPEFKAGLHCGPVIAAQIGELKRDVVFNGDVLNTTARIQASCNRLGRRLLASADLVEQLSLGTEYRLEPMGDAPLRGKQDLMRLYAITRAVDRSQRGERPAT